MSDIRLKKITIESGELQVQNGTVRVIDTTPSRNLMSGALVVNGGVTISCTENATSQTSGGGMSIAGGLSALGSAFLGKDVVLSNPSGQFAVAGISDHRFFVDTTSNKNVYFCPDGVNKTVEINNSTLRIHASTESTNGSTGALVVNGGVSISTTGPEPGLYLQGDLEAHGIITGDHIRMGTAEILSNTAGWTITNSSEIKVSSGIKLLSNSNVTAEFESTLSTLRTQTIIAVTSPSSNASTGALVVNGGASIQATNEATSTTSGGALTLGGGLAVAKNTHMGGTLELCTNLDMTEKLKLDNLAAIGSTSGKLTYNSPEHLFYNANGGSPTLKVQSGNVNLNETHTLTTLGSSGSLIISSNNSVCNVTILGNSVSTVLGHNSTRGFLKTTGEGPLVIQDTLYLSSVGDLTAGGNVTCDGQFQFKNTQNASSSTSGAVRLDGGLGIAQDLFIGGKCVIGDTVTMDTLTNGNTSSLMLSGTHDLNMRLFSSSLTTTKDVSFQLYTLGFDTLNANHEALQIKSQSTSGYVITASRSGTGAQRTLTLNAGTSSQIVLGTTGNVGIGTSQPAMLLDVAGTVNCTGVMTVQNTTSSALVVQGGIHVNGTRPSIGLGSGGALTVAGGASVDKDAYFGGVVTFTCTTPSTSYADGAVNIRGGLTISNNQAAANVGNGGALTVAGGASIGGDLWVGGSINGSGSSSSSYAYLTLTSTDEAVNFSSGSLVSFGGITIQCTTNSTSVTNGGSLLVRGGASFGGGLYVDGDNFFYGTTSYITQYSNSILDFYDNLKMLKFAMTLDSNFNLVRYDASGDPIDNPIQINHTTGAFTVNQDALVMGALQVHSTTNSLNASSGGAVTIAGGMSVGKDTLIGGDIVVYSTTESVDISSGALVVYGGVGVSGNMNVLGNTIIVGNLTVNGTTTTIQTENTVLKDNVFLLNSGPAGSRDSGFLIQRYQNDNDSGEGDVVHHTAPQQEILPSQSGMSSTQLKLSTSASSVDNYYQNWWIKIAGGFSNNQVRKIISYTGSTRVAVVSSAFTGQNPGIGDVVLLCNKSYVGLTFNELSDRFQFGSTVVESGSNVQLTDYIDIVTADVHCTSVVSSSGVMVNSTTEATGSSVGGTITTLGGIGVAKSAHIGGDLVVQGVTLTPSSGDIFKTREFTGGIALSPQPVTGLSFSTGSYIGFDCWLAAKVELSSGSLFAHYHIRGISKESSYDIVRTYVGDDLGIDFGISSGGQIVYTTPNYNSFTSLTFRFRALTV